MALRRSGVRSSYTPPFFVKSDDFQKKMDDFGGNRLFFVITIAFLKKVCYNEGITSYMR